MREEEKDGEIKEATWGRNRYEVTVTRNLFKSRPWEKQANNQSNCKIEFPASRKAGSALLESLVAPVALPPLRFPCRPPSSWIRRLRSEVVKGRRGNFCANVMVYSRGGFCSRETLIKFVRDWRIFVALWRTRWFSSHCQQITSPFLLHRRFPFVVLRIQISRYIASECNANCRNVIFFCCSVLHGLTSRYRGRMQKCVWTSFAVQLHSSCTQTDPHEVILKSSRAKLCVWHAVHRYTLVWLRLRKESAPGKRSIATTPLEVLNGRKITNKTLRNVKLLIKMDR